MKFFKSLFKSRASDKPEDYSRIYFRWERNGREYGPMGFENMLTNKWSGPPIEGRFESESKWRDYSYFLNVLDVLKISQKQISEMKKLSVKQIDSMMSFKDAVKVIQLKNEEVRRIKEEINKAKELLPATKQSIKKLKTFGIEFDENVTQGEAKKLISIYKEREYLSEIFDNLKKMKVNFIDQLSIDKIVNNIDKNMPSFDQFEEFYTILQSLSNYKIEFAYPNSINSSEMEILINKFVDAQFEAEDIEEQLKDRDIFVEDGEFKVIGKLPKNQLLKIQTDIISRCLMGNWNASLDLKAIVKEHLPEVVLKEID